MHAYRTSRTASRVRYPLDLRGCLPATMSIRRQVEEEIAFNTEMLTVQEGEGGKRLDSFLGGRMPEQSRSYFGGLCQLGMVLVGGKRAKKSAKVEEGQEVEVRFIISPELSLDGEDIPLDVSPWVFLCERYGQAVSTVAK